MRFAATVTLNLVLCAPLSATETLPDDFLSASPTVKLFKAYAEFKMANYDLAQGMWLSIQGSARAEALFNLGILYDQGLGVAADIDQALTYYRQAARLGSRSAAYQLGVLYLNDPRLLRDEGEAEHWLTVAAHDGDEDATRLLRQLAGEAKDDPLYRIQQLLRRGETEQAVSHLHQLAGQGDPRALTRLAWLYEAGLGVGKDLDQAARLFRQAAEAGHAPAQYALAVMLMTGSGQKQDVEAGITWLQKAADQGYASAIRALAAYSGPS